jgi:hypothetical protein
VALAVHALTILAAGAGMLLAFIGASMGSPGRPFRKGRRRVSAELAPGDEWCGDASTPAALPHDKRAGVVAFLRATAREEHAAVATFSRAAQTLMALGAPPELVDDTLAAARDEIRHAQVALSLLRKYGEVALSPAPCGGFMAAASDDFLQSTYADGCVNEGLSALLFEHLSTHAAEWAPREEFAAIAADEARHADLAWRTLFWCAPNNAPQIVVPPGLPPWFLAAQPFFVRPLASDAALDRKLAAFRSNTSNYLKKLYARQVAPGLGR